MIEEKKEEKFIPLTSDTAFKYLFRKKEILKDFLEDIIEEEIEDLEYLDSLLEREKEEAKECALDVRVKLKDQTYINVEMQKSKKGDMLKRSLYYTSLMIQKSIKIKEEYDKISRYIGINILAYNDKRFKNYQTIMQMYDKKEIEEGKIKEAAKSDVLQIQIINLKSEKNNIRKYINGRRYLKKGKVGKWSIRIRN